jgi:O-antigen/teichoic acid export membrane protein
MKKAKFYCLQCWIEFVLNAVAIIVLIRFFGVIGIAMAPAVVFPLMILRFYFYFKQHIRDIENPVKNTENPSR